MRSIPIGLLAILVTLVTGCGGPSEIQSEQADLEGGKYLFEGKPYSGTIIFDRFVPTSDLPKVKGFTLATAMGMDVDANRGKMDFRDGAVSGEVLLKRDETLILEGTVKPAGKDGEPAWVGERKLYWRSGDPRLFQEFDEQGELHGQLTLYCEDSAGRKSKSVQFKHGEVTGTRQHFYCDTKQEQLEEQTVYSDTGRTREIWYRNGQLASKVTYNKDDEENGTSTTHYENGQLQAQGEMQNGHQVGKWKYWHANGQIQKTLELDKLGPNGFVTSFDANGNIDEYVYYGEENVIPNSLTKPFVKAMGMYGDYDVRHNYIKSRREHDREKLLYYINEGLVSANGIITKQGPSGDEEKPRAPAPGEYVPSAEAQAARRARDRRSGKYDRYKHEGFYRPIHVAPTALFDVLVEKGAKLDERDPTYRTRLHWCALGLVQKTCTIEHFKQLLSMGMDINSKDKFGETAFSLIMLPSLDTRGYRPRLDPKLAALQQQAVTTALELGAEVNVSNREGQTPLMRLLATKRFALAEELINKGADVTATNTSGMAPIHFVFFFSDTQYSLDLNEERRNMLRTLVAKGADLSTPIHNGKSLKEIAISDGEIETAQYIDSLAE